MDEAELKLRTRRFALRCIKLAESLPRTRAGNAIAGQLIDAGTSVGSNYRAACRGRSKREFIAKLGTVEEEADESAFWMEFIMEYGLKPARLVQALHDESEAIVKIVASSIKTAPNCELKIQNHQSKTENG
jgi:four helix bundle protein